MATLNKTMQLIATKLGLRAEEKVLSKAAELDRLLQTKSTAGSNMTETSKIVICLDLAATMFGVSFDIKTAIKYSGLKSTTYTNNRKVVENLLKLNMEKLTTTLLCLNLNCNNVQTLADKILDDYQRQAKTEIDLNLPQYVCMAVYQACRISKVKIPKTKLIEKSNLKPAQWTKLDADWTKYVDEHFTVAKKKRERKQKDSIKEDIEEKMELDIAKQDEQQLEPQIESYDDWKQRMLEIAYKELKELEQVENKMSAVLMSPRRSPRKTPQKFSPYKSPRKTNGVRLLFPLDL